MRKPKDRNRDLAEGIHTFALALIGEHGAAVKKDAVFKYLKELIDN